MGKLLLDSYEHGKLKSVRNKDGLWINVQPFREAGNFYMKHGYYIADPWGSPAWIEFWARERNRCIDGYSIGGYKITGDHYMYMNYCPILKVDELTGNVGSKVEGFPDFWDGDYNYFWVREIARKGVFGVDEEVDRQTILNLPSEEQAKELKRLYENLGLEVEIEIDYIKGGYNLIVGKSRRKGYSYKAAGIAANNFFNRSDALTIFGAYDKKFLYPKGIFSMFYDDRNFINKNTAWTAPSDVIDKVSSGHLKNSYKEKVNGVEIELGLLSEVMSLSFQDNEDAARGKDAYDVFFEESGAFGTPGLLKRSYLATKDTVRAGIYKTGLITIFGTSGDMDGGTADYADMFTRPLAYELLPFVNIWDADSRDMKVGFFHPVNWNMEGYYDENGNSDLEGAKNYELEIRKQLIKHGAVSSDIQARMQENPIGPSEAFGAVSVNNFPVVELNRQIRKVKAKNWHMTKGTPVDLYYEDGTVKAKPNFSHKVEPILSYNNEPLNKTGCPVIYEYPVDNPPKGLYKIGYDPVRQDTGTSLAAIIVYKGVHTGTLYHSNIVAEYIGRMESPEDMDRVAEKLAVLYNTQIMHENEVSGVKNYFRRNKKLHLLAQQPDAVISKNVKKSKVARVYGCHMNEPLKDAGERYVKDWLLTVLDYDENGDPVTVIDRIYSLRLLEELVAYYRKGNFDLVSALFMCMFQVQEESIGTEYGENNQNKNAQKLLKMMDRMYQKN